MNTYYVKYICYTFYLTHNIQYNFIFILRFDLNIKLITLLQFYRMNRGSESIIGGRDPVWKYCPPINGNINNIICNYCGMVIKSGGITWFKFLLSYTDPHSNRKKCSNVPPEMKKEMKQLLVQTNKAKGKKTVDIEEI